ncbi:MotA/TolQ/ExbB proton channel family protein [Acinetobacter qingfengensis]|uniref:MotA/TolQ/ExbB proton channel domain-containing protein n=1 Tax=Acinetobacter qingfengensis TaxID=1262585 RepID=A0A1E7RD58_9GAMM|nr:MotA/TolQ/ExbB proton channel family protein [Acinetobacter qingfengensis]KAA8732113.1 MotA/TolQ/ExbB proton channel family protein [Acinetobacter qingfengensis]OEY97192.1 hypothetical protein BJI46_01840 [Acinetobacter qingfengensis]
MNADLVHNIIFYIMYASLVLLCIIFVERAIYFAYTLKQSRMINDAVEKNTLGTLSENQEKNPVYQMIVPFLKSTPRSENERADLLEKQYLQSKGLLNRGIWILETIVTAAPLLGLLGTILGIIDTFSALAASGVSDPSKVSAGMGTALYATGLGIAIALVALVANNFLGSRMEKITEMFKVLLINVDKGQQATYSNTKTKMADEKQYA